ncbi:hypothetical protein CapIbe_002280 [Capra ibex]
MDRLLPRQRPTVVKAQACGPRAQLRSAVADYVLFSAGGKGEISDDSRRSAPRCRPAAKRRLSQAGDPTLPRFSDFTHKPSQATAQPHALLVPPRGRSPGARRRLGCSGSISPFSSRSSPAQRRSAVLALSGRRETPDRVTCRGELQAVGIHTHSSGRGRPLWEPRNGWALGGVSSFTPRLASSAPAQGSVPLRSPTPQESSASWRKRLSLLPLCTATVPRLRDGGSREHPPAPALGAAEPVHSGSFAGRGLRAPERVKKTARVPDHPPDQESRLRSDRKGPAAHAWEICRRAWGVGDASRRVEAWASGQSALWSASWVRVCVSAPLGEGQRWLCVLKYVSERPAPVPSSPLPDRTSGPGTALERSPARPTAPPRGPKVCDLVASCRPTPGRGMTLQGKSM